MAIHEHLGEESISEAPLAVPVIVPMAQASSLSVAHTPLLSVAQTTCPSNETHEKGEAAGVCPPGPARKALVVLGMHRSGTSAVTRMLSLLGSDLPQHLMPAVQNDNARGFWESQRLADLHDEMLAEAGSSGMTFLPMPEGWCESSVAQKYVQKLAGRSARSSAHRRFSC